MTRNPIRCPTQQSGTTRAGQKIDNSKFTLFVLLISPALFSTTNSFREQTWLGGDHARNDHVDGICSRRLQGPAVFHLLSSLRMSNEQVAFASNSPQQRVLTLSQPITMSLEPRKIQTYI